VVPSEQRVEVGDAEGEDDEERVPVPEPERSLVAGVEVGLEEEGPRNPPSLIPPPRKRGSESKSTQMSIKDPIPRV